MNGCFHCGEPLPSAGAVRLTISDLTQDFCCAGCAAAATWIAGAGLGDYYRIRATPSPQVSQFNDSASVFERPALLARWSRPCNDDGNSGQSEIAVQVRGLRCAACAWLVRRVAAQIGKLEVLHIDPLSGQALLRYQNQQPRLAALARQLAELGYAMHASAAGATEQQRLQGQRTRTLRLIIAGLGAMQAMMFAWPLYGAEGGDLPLAVRDFFRWVGALVTAPVVIYSGWPFFSGAIAELRLRRLGMDTPIALAIALAFAGSIGATLWRGEAVYFESVAMFVFLLLLGRSAESMLRERAQSRMAGLAENLPSSARRLLADVPGTSDSPGSSAALEPGKTETIALLELQIGDRIQLLAGETVPVDGRVLQRDAQISEAFLSGESTPLNRPLGCTVLAGSVVVERPLLVEVLRIGADTALGELERLVQRAAAGRPRWTRLADQAAQSFVFVVLAAAAATALAWAGSSVEQALAATVAVLAAACPCALSLALPAALSTGARALSAHGALLIREGALERLAEVDQLIFDKTGTLTCEPYAVSCQWAREGLSAEQALRLAAALERCSLHPLALALRRFDDPLLRVGDARESLGQGVNGIIDGAELRLGRAGFATVDANHAGPSGASVDHHSSLFLSDQNGPLARLVIEQQLREDAIAAMSALRELGMSISILSGDQHAAVQPIAQRLQIADFVSGCSPEDKVRRLQALQQQGKRVLMVGDGLNDAAVLAAAHASLALASGVDLARRQADGVLISGKLLAVAQALILARRTRRIVRQNLAWALGYNLLVIPAAALGLLGPWLAALGMSLSSLLVIGNALRLLGDGGTALSPRINSGKTARPGVDLDPSMVGRSRH